MLYPQHRPHNDILELFAKEKLTEHGFLRVSAPMVRYSKHEFRTLLRQYGVKLTFTPMIIADSFIHSQKARENEFTTSADDQPVIAQFAARNAYEFVTAAQLAYPYVDGVDLNCGCPQSWAIKKCYGCGLLRKPEIVEDIVKTALRTMPHNFSISLKIRLLGGVNSVRSTVELARQMEHCGVSFLTLHGRTIYEQSSDAVNVTAMAEIKKSLQIPLIANGSVRSWQDACRMYEATRADGIMAARGLLTNPALFAAEFKQHDKTPLECVQEWLNIAMRSKQSLHFNTFHHHLTFMCSSHMKRKLREHFNSLNKKQQVFDFMEEFFDMKPADNSIPFKYTDCAYTHYTNTLNDRSQSPASACVDTWNEHTNGKFFQLHVENNDEEENDFDLTETFFTELP